MAATSPVTVIIPTHAHATTLELSIRSVLEQTVTELDIVVIGDGVDDATREVTSRIRAEDSRVSFLDRPKAPRHGEVLRHEVLAKASSPVIAYHGDDDLLLPDHLAVMLGLLEGADFVHPLPILVDADGELIHLPTDLSLEQCRAWHLDEPPRNAVSLTGVVHTMEAYRRLPFGWRTTPPGRWTDHYMWQQFLQLDGIRLRTSPSATTVKMAAAQRESWTQQERGKEIQGWWDRMHASGFSAHWDSDVQAAVRLAATRGALRATHLEDEQTELARTIQQQAGRLSVLEAEFGDLQRRLADETARADDAQRTVAEVVNSHSWRLTAPMRAMRRPRG